MNSVKARLIIILRAICLAARETRVLMWRHVPRSLYRHGVGPAIGAAVNTNSAVYFGLCLCFSSTILVLGYLKSSKSMGTLYGQLCLGTHCEHD